MSMYVEQTEIAMPPSCTFIRERQERRAVAVAVEVKPVRSIQLIQLALHIMKRPWLTQSLAAKRQCLATTLAAVKDATTLMQIQNLQYEEQKKAHDAEIHFAPDNYQLLHQEPWGRLHSYCRPIGSAKPQREAPMPTLYWANICTARSTGTHHCYNRKSYIGS